MPALSQGIIVDHVVVYGIVMSIESQDRCKLLQLDMDFVDNMCVFKECDGNFPLDLLLNAILAHLWNTVARWQQKINVTTKD